MKVGEIFGTGKVITLSKGDYCIDGELTNIDKLREYDKAGILQWDSSELRELALGFDASTQSLASTVFCEECGTKQLGDAKFCEECGTVVERPAQPQASQGKNNPKNLIEKAVPIVQGKRIVTFIVVAVVLVAIFSIGAVTFETIRANAEQERVSNLLEQAQFAAALETPDSDSLFVMPIADYKERTRDSEGRLVKLDSDGEMVIGSISGRNSATVNNSDVIHFIRPGVTLDIEMIRVDSVTGTIRTVYFPPDVRGEVNEQFLLTAGFNLAAYVNAVGSFPHGFFSRPFAFEIRENDPSIYYDGKSVGTFGMHHENASTTAFIIDPSQVQLSPSGQEVLEDTRALLIPDSAIVFDDRVQELTTFGELVRNFR